MHLRALALVATIITLASCNKREAMLSAHGAEGKQDKDTTLSVAVVPELDCLPVYYAKRMGLFDSLGLDVRLLQYAAQADADTALARGRATLGHTSLARIEVMARKDGDTLAPAAMTSEPLYLITARTKRISKTKQLAGAVVAIDRHSDADLWSDSVAALAGLEATDIYRPQINDLSLRTLMLTEQLVDAAFLPEPWATQARLDGNRQVFATPASWQGFTCFATKQSKQAKAKVKLFIQAYNEAAKRLNATPEPDTLRAILQEQYGLEPQTADTLVALLPRLAPAHAPSDSLRATAAKWIVKRMNYKYD